VPSFSIPWIPRGIEIQRAEGEITKAGFSLAGTVNSLSQLGSPALPASMAFLARPTDSIALVRELVNVRRCRDTIVSAATGLLFTLKTRASDHFAAVMAAVSGDRGARRGGPRQAPEPRLRESSSTDISSRSGSWISVCPSVASDYY